jgi:hypothetical protein
MQGKRIANTEQRLTSSRVPIGTSAFYAGDHS